MNKQDTWFMGRLNRMFQAMIDERQSFENHWNDLCDYILPRRGRFFTDDTNVGGSRTDKILHSAGTLALRTLVSGMGGNVTSPSKTWFQIVVPEEELNDDLEVRVWTADVTDVISDILHKSNFYNNVSILYGDSAGFGTGCMLIQPDEEKTVTFDVFPPGSYYISRGAGGVINTFAREFRMTVREIVETFGYDSVSDYVKSQYDRDNYEDWIDVRMMVMPNEQFRDGGLTSKPFSVVYWETGMASFKSGRTQTYTGGTDLHLIKVAGYDVFPVLAFRWSVTGEDIYGTDCPGMTALPDIKELQKLTSILMKALGKMAEPPLVGPSLLKRIGVSTRSNAINYIDEFNGRQGLRSLYETDPRIEELSRHMSQRINHINNVFHVPLFMGTTYSDRREVTAREIEERHEEKLLALGPVLERLNTDVLDPLIDVVFKYALDSGKIPPPPQILAGRELKVQYTSVLAQAQKAGHLNGFERYLNFIGAVAKTNEDPAALDAVNMDTLVSEYGQIIGLPPRVFRDMEEILAIRADRQQAIQAQRAQEAMETMARSARDASQADMSGDSVLTRMAGGAA